MVMDMIKAAMANKDDYYQRDVNQEFIPQSENRTVLPPINGVAQGSNSLEKTVDRYVSQTCVCCGLEHEHFNCIHK